MFFFSIDGFADYLDYYHQKGEVAEHSLYFDAIYSYEHERFDDDYSSQDTSTVYNIFTYGVSERTDFIFEAPYSWTHNSDGSTSGWNDFSFYLSYKFYKSPGLSLYCMPEITIPNGNYEKGLGNGRATYGLVFSSVQNWGKYSLKSDFEYYRNENKINKRLDMWSVVITPKYTVNDRLELFFSTMISEDTDKSNYRTPYGFSGGFDYKVTKNFDILPYIEVDYGRPETDVTAYLDFSWKLF
ncbi:MAG: hypothetical protein A2X78_05180 [Gammaproteobacteria bacterium GWE2_37_16]|nr:MAG: hypothetical protein A2X78_05180 [Gammaproteobacteria bacterium GWE2_37_16]